MADRRICSAPGCSKFIHHAPYCSMHEARLRRGGTLERRVEKMTLSQILGGKMLFGLWQVLSEGSPYIRPDNGEQMRQALCRCACGTERLVAIHTLKQGASRHCGCRQAVINDASHLRHGDTRRGRSAPEYRAWSKAIGRCYNPNDGSYDDYGGRGITVCERWREDYVNFLADMGRRPKGMSIDRIDVNGNYEPSNCRWVTGREQAQNTRTNVLVTFRGSSMALIQACREAGIEHRYKAIHQRMKRQGKTFAEAIGSEGISTS